MDWLDKPSMAKKILARILGVGAVVWSFSGTDEAKANDADEREKRKKEEKLALDRKRLELRKDKLEIKEREARLKESKQPENKD